MLNNKHDKIAGRLVEIIRRLHNGETLYREELAMDFNVHEKTIRKDMNERLCFLPINHHKGVYTIDKIALGNLDYSDIKNFAQISGLIGLYPNLNLDFIVDLLNVKVNTIYQVKNQGYDTPNTELFRSISKAILKKEFLDFFYNDKARTSNPYKLLNNKGIWYLMASEDGKLKHFTLSKIKDCKVLENHHFKLDPSIQEQIEQSSIQWASSELTEVVLKIDTKAWDYFSRKNTLANQIVLEKNSEYITISTKISFDDEILNIVKSYIPYICIISPLSLKEKLELQLHDYLKNNK